jgi:cytochrome c5
MGESSEAVSQPPGSSAAAGSRTAFLSYASPDAVVANQVCEFCHGVACWMAPRDVKPGADPRYKAFLKKMNLPE